MLMMVSIPGADCYKLNTRCYSMYGFEYKPGFIDDNAVSTFSPYLDAREPLVDARLSLAVYLLGQK